jgi:hypothetical protein
MKRVCGLNLSITSITHTHLHSQIINSTFPPPHFFPPNKTQPQTINMRASIIFTTLFAAFVAAAPAPIEASAAEIEVRQVSPLTLSQPTQFPTLFPQCQHPTSDPHNSRPPRRRHHRRRRASRSPRQRPRRRHQRPLQARQQCARDPRGCRVQQQRNLPDLQGCGQEAACCDDSWRSG